MSEAVVPGAPTTEYWFAVATVLPVLALALVVEARAIARQWSEDTPSWIMLTQAAFWGVPLLAFAYALPLSLGGVRGTEPAAWLPPRFIEIMVGVSVGVLLLAPVLKLFTRAGARQIATVLTLDLRDRLGRWRYRRSRRKVLAETNAFQRELQVAHSRIRTNLDGLEAAERELRQAAPCDPRVEALAEKVQSVRTEGDEMVARQQYAQAESQSRLAKIAQDIKASDEAIRQNRVARRKALAALLFLKTGGGLGSTRADS